MNKFFLQISVFFAFNLAARSLEVISGGMCSGKSAELLRRLDLCRHAEQKFVVFKPAKSFLSESIESRNGSSREAIVLQDSELCKIAETISNDKDIKVLAFDEFQFFPAQIIQEIYSILHNKEINARIIVSGLDKDFAGKPFGPMGDILAMADRVEKFTAICHVCKQDNATMSMRVVENTDVVLTAKESYVPVCREHLYIPGEQLSK